MTETPDYLLTPEQKLAFANAMADDFIDSHLKRYPHATGYHFGERHGQRYADVV